MAEDAGEKTEDPTPRKRQKAREQGNIPRSQDLSAAALVVGAILTLDWYGEGLVKALKALLSRMLSPESLSDFSPHSMTDSFVAAILSVAGAMFPMFVGVVLVAIVVNILQVGLYFNGQKLQPNLGALNPVKGLSKLLKDGQALFKFGMNLLKLGAVAAVAYTAVHGRLEQIVTVQQLSYLQIFGLGTDIVFDIAIRIGVFLLVLAIIDYAYQRYRIEQQLKMTKQEVKDEMRSMDGDPHIKQRRRQIARQIAMNKLRKDVPTADVVVTNPTEFAVALKYDAGSMHAPRVVAKGQDYMALRIRELAIQHGIPILERKPLARALYKMCEVGHEIPEQFYAAVAEILAYVYELTGKAKRRQSA